MSTNGWSVDSFRSTPSGPPSRTSRWGAYTAGRARRAKSAARAAGAWIGDRLDDALTCVGLGFGSLATFVQFGPGPGLYATGVAFVLAGLLARD